MSLATPLSRAPSRCLLCAASAAALLLPSLARSAELIPPPVPTAAALEAFHTLAASRMGVDHTGNLWAWNRRSGRVEVLSPQGRRSAMPSAENASGVDVDAAWGVAAVFEELRWLRPDEPAVSIRLGGQAADVCWIDPHTVAVSPQTNAHRAEIWDLTTRALVRSLGQEEPAPAGAGAFRLRNVLLQCDREHGRLYTLESFTGELQVFKTTGQLLWRAAIPSSPDAGLAEEIAAKDREAKAAGRRVPLTFSRFFPALDSAGDLWVVQDSRRSTRTVDLLHVTPSGEAPVHLTNQACPTQSFTFWGDAMLFYTDPAHGGGVCNAVRRPS